MTQMLKSSGAMGAATLSSRVLGMAREIVYAHFMGDNTVAGAFQFAFMVPNLFRRLLGEGALTAAFIPLFKEKEKRDGDAAMWGAANAVISGLVLAAGAITVLAVAALSLVLAFWPLAPERQLMLELLRLMFPYMLLVCLAALFMAMLNARGHFFLPAFGATLLNLVMIASVLFLAPALGPRLEQQIFGLALGVLVAGLVQAGFQIPTLRQEGFRFRWIDPRGHPDVREVLSKMIPGTLGVAAFQLNMLATQGVAVWLDPQMVAAFNYAVRMMELPQGVFGISLATYLLPTLSGLAAEKNFPEFNATVKQGLGYILCVNLVAAAGLCALAEPILRLLFERGEFTAGSTARAAWALTWLAPGLIAFSLVNILARAFYALGDTQTPMKIGVVCLLTNLLITLWLIGPFRQAGLAIANSATGALNVALLLYALRRKLRRLDLAGVWRAALELVPLAIASGLIAWGAWRLWESRLGHASFALKTGAVFVPMLLAAASYFLPAALWLRNPAARDLLAWTRRRRPAP
jgi:putative peptidoglycan lipid II flippase